MWFLVACYATLHPALSVCPSVLWSVRRSVRLTRFIFLLFFFCSIWHHCSCPNDEVTSITAPAHPHATGLAVYPALLIIKVDVLCIEMSKILLRTTKHSTVLLWLQRNTAITKESSLTITVLNFGFYSLYKQ